MTELFDGHIELDVEQDRLRSANKAEAKPIGVHPAKFEPVPLSFQTGAPPPQTGYAPAPAKPKRAGWLGGWT